MNKQSLFLPGHDTATTGKTLGCQSLSLLDPWSKALQHQHHPIPKLRKHSESQAHPISKTILICILSTSTVNFLCTVKFKKGCQVEKQDLTLMTNELSNLPQPRGEGNECSQSIYLIPLACWYMLRGFPGGSDRKDSACNAGDLGCIPGQTIRSYSLRATLQFLG